MHEITSAFLLSELNYRTDRIKSTKRATRRGKGLRSTRSRRTADTTR